MNKYLGIFFFIFNTLLNSVAIAETFPQRPIKIVVPYGPGGAADQLTRMIGNKLSKDLGQQVVIENIAGAGTIVGTDRVAKSVADGYTLLLCSSTSFVNNPIFKNNLPYKVERDFSGISLIASSPMVLIAGLHTPYNSVAEFIKYAKENPGKVSYASAGPGSTLQLAAELFQSQTGIKMLHIPYKSNIEAGQAVLSQQVDIAFDIVLSSQALVQSKKLKGLATTDLKRIALLPNLPTVSEAGVLGYEIAAWYGFATPKGTPTEIIDKLNQALKNISSDAELKQNFNQLGLELRTSEPNELMALSKKDQQNLAKLIQERGIKVDQ